MKWQKYDWIYWKIHCYDLLLNLHRCGWSGNEVFVIPIEFSSKGKFISYRWFISDANCRAIKLFYYLIIYYSFCYQCIKYIYISLWRSIIITWWLLLFIGLFQAIYNSDWSVVKVSHYHSFIHLSNTKLIAHSLETEAITWISFVFIILYMCVHSLGRCLRRPFYQIFDCHCKYQEHFHIFANTIHFV